MTFRQEKAGRYGANQFSCSDLVVHSAEQHHHHATPLSDRKEVIKDKESFFTLLVKLVVSSGHGPDIYLFTSNKQTNKILI